MPSRRMIACLSAVFLVLVLALASTGCGTSEKTDTAQSADTTASRVAEPAPASETAAKTPAEPAPSSLGTMAKVTPPARSASRPPADQMASAGKGVPAPAERTVTVAAGTVIKGTLQTPLSSKTNKVGDVISLTVSEPVVVDGETVIPAGMVIHGTVKAVNPAGRASQKGSIALSFDSITLASGKTLALAASQAIEGQADAQVQGESKKGRNAALIAGGTAAGALAGKLLGKDTKSTAIGAAAGGAAGTATALALKGGEVDMKEGSPLTVKLDNPLHVPVRVTAGSNVAKKL